MILASTSMGKHSVSRVTISIMESRERERTCKFPDPAPVHEQVTLKAGSIWRFEQAFSVRM